MVPGKAAAFGALEFWKNYYQIQEMMEDDSEKKERILKKNTHSSCMELPATRYGFIYLFLQCINFLIRHTAAN